MTTQSAAAAEFARRQQSPLQRIQALLHAYPWVTLTAIVLTANHYFLDAAGGLVCLGLGYVLGRALDDWWHQHGPRSRVRADSAPAVA